MILSTDTQITDQALLEITQQKNIDCVCSYVKKLLGLPLYNFRIFEWTARIENGEIIRADKTLLNYYDFYPGYSPNSFFPYTVTKTNFYQERVKIIRRIEKLRDDQFIEFEVYDNLSGRNTRVQNQ